LGLPPSSFEDLHCLRALGQDELAYVGAHGLDQPDHVAHGRVRVRADHEVREAQGVEDDAVVLDVMRVVEQLAQLAPRRRGRHPVDAVRGLHRSHEVHRAAHAADGGHGPGHLLDGHALEEFFISPEFHGLEKGIVHVPGIVQEDGDLPVTLQSRDRVDLDLSHCIPL
jgi:hypothetical protein